MALNVLSTSPDTSGGAGQPLKFGEKRSDIIRTLFIGVRDLRGQKKRRAGGY